MHGIIGQVIENGWAAEANAKARAQAVRECMDYRGYAKAPLTDKEAQSFRALTTEGARDAWVETFLSGDIDARIKAAEAPLAPNAPPLPAAEDAMDPFVIRAVRIDPASLSLAAGSVKAGDEILAGKARLRRTAVLKDEFREKVFRVHAGTVFQEYLEPAPWDPRSGLHTIWCGFDRIFYCFRNTLDGYEARGGPLGFGLGSPWLITNPAGMGLFNWPQPWKYPVALVVQPKGGEEAFDFRLVVSRVSNSAVYISANAENHGDTVEFWAGSLKFDATGTARLPFWDRTLVLLRDGQAVKAAFEPRSDGNGWLEAIPDE